MPPITILVRCSCEFYTILVDMYMIYFLVCPIFYYLFETNSYRIIDVFSYIYVGVFTWSWSA